MRDFLEMLLPRFDSGDGAGGSGGSGGTDGDKEGGTPPEKNTGELMIPKYRFDEVSKKLKEYQATLADMEEKTKELEQREARIAELEAEIENLKKTHEEEKIKSKKYDVIKAKLFDRVVDFDLVVSLLDFNKIQVNDEGKVKGLSAQVKELQKSKPYLWKPAQPIVKPGASDKAKTEKTFAQKLAERRASQLAEVKKGKNYF